MLVDLEKAHRPSPVPGNERIWKRRGGDAVLAKKDVALGHGRKAVAAVFLLSLVLCWCVKSRCALSLLVITIQPAALYWGFWSFRLSRYVRECSALCVFAAGFFLSIFAASYEQVAQFVLARVMGYVSSDVALAAHSVSLGGVGRTTVRSVVGSLSFFVLLSYGTTALVEEVFKLGASKSQALCQYVENEEDGNKEDNRGCRRHRAMAALILAVAGASGFATIENIVYLIGPSVAQFFNGNIADSAGGIDSTVKSSDVEYWNMALYRVIVVATLHVICGVLTGANIAHRDLVKRGTVLWCLAPAVILHGSYNLLINILHAKELRMHAHHTSVLWGIGVLALAAGVLFVKVAGETLQNELRASRKGTLAAIVPLEHRLHNTHESSHFV